jgi:F420-dependent oxidoreductase-like protein
MRACLMIEGQEGVTWEHWVALAEACERHGVETLFRSDHYSGIGHQDTGSLDAWATLAALAARTRTLRLGTLVSPATFRHPSVLARAAVTVDHVSEGRVEVGMGAGWLESEHVRNGFPFLDAPTRFALLAEQVEIVVRSWTEVGWGFAGAHYRLERQTAAPRPVQRPHPPLILGGSVRPRLATLAARWADEVNTPFATPGQCAERRQALDRACVAAGRDPASLPLSLMTRCIVAEGRADVRERLRRRLAADGDDRDPDDVLAHPDDTWLVGTVEEVLDRLGAYRAAGVERVMLQHLDHEDLDTVRIVGEHLAPALAGRHG